MALKYITGNSGYGKTAYCINEIIQYEKQGCNTILIVPEQFTLESEKLLIDAMPNKTILYAQVLSFKRLAYRLSEEQGGVPNKVLNAQGKLMLLRKIVYELADSLNYFNKVIDKQGFLEQLNLIIREFFQYNITPDILENISNSADNENLAVKLKDLQLIYKKYLEYINNYVVDEQYLTLVCNKLENSEFLRNAEIWIDGFTGFTPQEFSLIKKLICICKNVRVSLILNSKAENFNNIPPFDPFYETKTTIKKLNMLAAECKVPVLPAVHLNEDLRHKNNKELAFIKQGYFSYKQYNEKPENIGIYTASIMYWEIDCVCRKIVEVVKKNDYRFDDVTVILGSEKYEKPLKTAFESYGIPNFIDTGVSVLNHPLTDFILSVFEIVNYNFTYKSVCRCMKSGMLKMDFEDICVLENYILANGIKGYKWSFEEWKYGGSENIEKINMLKNQFIELILPFTSQIKNDKKYTVKHITEVIFNLLSHINATETLSDWIEKAKDDNNFVQAKIHQSIWDMLADLYDKMVEILGDEEVTSEEYYKILTAGLSGCEIGLIPPTQDHIIVGNSTRTRLPGVKAMFVLGVTEGCLPAYAKDVGVLSDADRECITELGYEVAPDNRQKINLDRLAIFMTLTKPTEFLYLSYPTGDISGNKCRPSSIIHKFKSMFPCIKEEFCENRLNFIAPEPAFARLTEAVSHIREGKDLEEEYKDIYAWFNENPQYKDRLTKIQEGILSDIPQEFLSGEALKSTFGDSLYLSVSRLEKFAACPFSFFMEYVIKARERQEYALYTPISVGNIYHEALKSFSDMVESQPDKSWGSLTKSDIETMVNESVDKAVQASSSDIMLETGKFRYAVKRIKDYLNRSVWALSKHVAAGSFVPAAYELSFGIDGDMPAIVFETEDNKKLFLNGKIDRVDIFNKDDRQYIKVIDYKSGVSYSLDQIFYGLKPQLILYLDALIKNQQLKAEMGALNENLKIDKGMTALPAGMFYFGINNPVAEMPKNINPLQAEEIILNKFKMKGLILDDADVINAVDKEYNQESKGIYSLDNSDTASLDNFNALREHAVDVTKKFGSEILKGNIDVLPYKYGDRTGCDYCPFSAVCRIDTVERKEKYKNLNKIKSEEVWKELSKELPEEVGEDD